MTDIINHTQRSEALLELVERTKQIPNFSSVKSAVSTCNGISKTLAPLTAISSQSQRLGVVYAASSTRLI